MATTPNASPHETVEACLRTGSSRRWRWHLGEGMCLILLGAVSLFAAASASSAFWGASLLAVGAATLLAVWRAEQYPGFAFSLLQALIAFATGLHLLGDPPDAMLGLALAAYFLSRGIVSVLISLAHRRQLLTQWEWFTVSGVTSLILALLILSGLPGPFTWMLGLLLGVDLIFDGSALLALVLTNGLEERVPAAASLERQSPALVSGPVCEDGIQ